MHSSAELGEVIFVATPHTKGQPRQQHLRIEGGVNRSLLELFRSYLTVFQNEIHKIEPSSQPDASIVIIMTENVKTAQVARKVTQTLIERVNTFIKRQHRIEENRRRGHGFAVDSDVKAYHGSD